MKRKDLSSLKQQEKVKLNYEGVHSFISATVRYATLSPECIEAVLIRVQENAEPPAGTATHPQHCSPRSH
jgi:hypothetical protein